jgi:hypothetical protein
MKILMSLPPDIIGELAPARNAACRLDQGHVIVVAWPRSYPDERRHWRGIAGGNPGCRRRRCKRIVTKDKGRSERPRERRTRAKLPLDKTNEVGYNFGRWAGLDVSKPVLRYRGCQEMRFGHGQSKEYDRAAHAETNCLPRTHPPKPEKLLKREGRETTY